MRFAPSVVLALLSGLIGTPVMAAPGASAPAPAASTKPEAATPARPAAVSTEAPPSVAAAPAVLAPATPSAAIEPVASDAEDRREPDPSDAGCADPSAAPEDGPDIVALEGTLVSKSPEEVVMRDGDGNEHHLRVNEQTRYVWSETTAPQDFTPGARIRSQYMTVHQQQFLVAVWVLAPAARATASLPVDERSAH